MLHPKGPSFADLIREALSSTDAGYDHLAPKFEFTPFRTPDELLKAAAAATPTAGTGLDLCTGTGAALRAFRPRCEVMVGVDRSAGMLAEARRRSAGDAGVKLVQGDALALPFARCFDLVTCFGAFGHILERDEPGFVDEIHRVLRPGGRFVFVTANEPSPLNPGYWLAHGFNAAMRVRNALLKPEFVMYYLTFLLPRARALLEARGFKVEATVGTLPRPYHRLSLVTATAPA